PSSPRNASAMALPRRRSDSCSTSTSPGTACTDEHAAGTQDLGGFPGLLGSHVPQRVGEQLRRAWGARPLDDAQTSVAAMVSGAAVRSTAEIVRAVPGLAHSRPLRPGGAGAGGLHVVGARRA